jgi:hypothetical protein
MDLGDLFITGCIGLFAVLLGSWFLYGNYILVRFIIAGDTPEAHQILHDHDWALGFAIAFWCVVLLVTVAVVFGWAINQVGVDLGLRHVPQ